MNRRVYTGPLNLSGSQEDIRKHRLSQLRENVALSNDLVERCFAACGTDFTNQTLSSKEKQCVDDCTQKYFNYKKAVDRCFKKSMFEKKNRIEPGSILGNAYR